MTYNSSSISAELPVLMSDIFDAIYAVGIQSPTTEQIEEVAQYVRDEAKNASIVALEHWKEHRKSEGMSEEKVGLEAMWEVIRELAKRTAFVLNDEENYECPFCGNTAMFSSDFMHSPACIVIKARALVADREKGQHGNNP